MNKVEMRALDEKNMVCGSLWVDSSCDYNPYMLCRVKGEDDEPEIDGPNKYQMISLALGDWDGRPPSSYHEATKGYKPIAKSTSIRITPLSV